jgi:hypothetical protein
MIVAAALVCAIAVGGGLAFGYKKLVADGSKSATPIVKADRSPVREKPRDPGGKEQPHTDKKFPNRLDEKATPPPAAVAPQAPPAGPAENEGGPRRVTTVIINKDGTITPSVPPAPAGPPPGMVVENVPRPELRGPAQPERVAAPPPAPPVVPVQKAPPAQPRVADLPLPKVRPEPRAEAPQPQAPPPARKKPAIESVQISMTPLSDEANCPVNLTFKGRVTASPESSYGVLKTKYRFRGNDGFATDEYPLSLERGKSVSVVWRRFIEAPQRDAGNSLAGTSGPSKIPVYEGWMKLEVRSPDGPDRESQAVHFRVDCNENPKRGKLKN